MKQIFKVIQYDSQLYANKTENLGKMHEFLGKCNLPKLNWEEIKTWLSITIKKRKSVNKKILGLQGCAGHFL